MEARPFQKAFAAVVLSSAGTVRQTTCYWWLMARLREAAGKLAVECVAGASALTLKALKVDMNKRPVPFVRNLRWFSLCSTSHGDGAEIYTSHFSH